MSYEIWIECVFCVRVVIHAPNIAINFHTSYKKNWGKYACWFLNLVINVINRFYLELMEEKISYKYIFCNYPFNKFIFQIVSQAKIKAICINKGNFSAALVTL
jgi:hypothetical protein